MKISIVSFPIGNSLEGNFSQIKEAIETSPKADIWLFPEGALTGYDCENGNFIKNINFDKLNQLHQKCRNLTIFHKTNLIIGSIEKEDNKYYNAAFIFLADGTIQKYRKINLAFFDKKHFITGNSLPVFEINGTKIGIQLCREVFYPEQWRLLALKGAKIIFHLNNCVGKEKYNLWKSYLISRAAENQRYVFSANTPSESVGCPTIAISPEGEVLEEINSKDKKIVTLTPNLELSRDYYLSQRRFDLFDIIEK
ncbi:MAG: carbon-nitrogen hydrolase family protein [Candidatus Nanoarchaeia archaeon]|nr:carbon-nitrogen hydrolase family protein [Candidatus Nanoarchaeia archaeon]